jgi:hypothetical protein
MGKTCSALPASFGAQEEFSQGTVLVYVRVDFRRRPLDGGSWKASFWVCFADLGKCLAKSQEACENPSDFEKTQGHAKIPVVSEKIRGRA